MFIVKLSFSVTVFFFNLVDFSVYTRYTNTKVTLIDDTVEDFVSVFFLYKLYTDDKIVPAFRGVMKINHFPGLFTKLNLIKLIFKKLHDSVERKKKINAKVFQAV